MAIGRISGPLLKANLIRDGVDLAFETDLLYLDVNNSRIGVNNSTPATDLDVNGTTRTTTLTVDNQLDIGNLTITGNTISTSASTINFTAASGEATVYNARLQVDDIEIIGNTIKTINSNADLEITPSGTGKLVINSDTDIDGNLYVTGNITADGNVTIGGNITIGDELTDTITINASITSDLIPESDDLYDIGASGLRWANVYVNNFNTSSFNTPTLDVGDISIRDNEISSGTGLDLVLYGNGTGGVQLGNFKITGNVIENVANNQITQILQTGTGYFKIDTTNGFVPPRGDNAQRPTAYAVVGMTRYNTNSRALEVWTGSAWGSPAGASGAVSEIIANDISASFALMLG